MATNEPNKPDNIINIDTAKTQAEEKTAPDQPVQAGGDTPAPEKATGQEQAVTTPAPEDKAPEKTAAPDKEAPEPAKQAARKGRPPKSEKIEKEPKPEKAEKQKKAVSAKNANRPIGKRGRSPKAGFPTPAKEEAPPTPEPEQPPVPRDATRDGEKEEIVYLNLSELHGFKGHPFGVRDDAEMRSLVESVKGGGVNQPALVRPREGGGYEIIAGHRRQKASELAGYANMPCIVRNMTDDEAILAMTDDNLRQRSEILPSEKAQSLKMQVEAIKHQGARDTSGQNVHKEDAGKRSVQIVGERNDMNGKQVQRYIRLTELVPDLQKAMDEKNLGFTSAVELSFIKRKNQNMIAVSMGAEDNSPSLSQAKRMRELDQKGLLNGDVIDGILCEQKKEVDKVIISGEELGKYFGKDKTPQQMKEQIIKLLDDWSGKEKELTPPVKKNDKEK